VRPDPDNGEDGSWVVPALAAWRPSARERRPVPPPTPRRLADALGGHLPPPRARIGLLGGSFNPAHGGHRRISDAALHRLGLDAVWWLVSPQNPLKPRAGMAPLADRLARAEHVIAGHPGLTATAIEGTLGTLYTADTLAELRRRMPGVRFVWLMGADNLAQIARWHRWRAIFESVPIAVLDRPAYSYASTNARAAHRFRHARLVEHRARVLADASPPAWVFVHQPRDPRSATRIRARQSGIEGAPCESVGRTVRHI
jgi:nicotinate-nucleotide adenylyltransferase